MRLLWKNLVLSGVLILLKCPPFKEKVRQRVDTSGKGLHGKKVLKGLEISAILRKTKGLELKECALLLADDLGIQPKAAFLSLGFAVPEMQEVRILSAWMALLCP